MSGYRIVDEYYEFTPEEHAKIVRAMTDGATSIGQALRRMGERVAVATTAARAFHASLHRHVPLAAFDRGHRPWKNAHARRFSR